MRLVGVAMVILGGAILGALATGHKPLDLVDQLIDLFGHQHSSEPARNVVAPVAGSASDLLGRAGAASAGAAAAAGRAAGAAS